MFKKFIMTSGVFFIFTCYIYSAPLVQDKFQSIVLTEYGIDTNNLFRGLNEIVQIGTTSYLVALNKDNRIAINKINDMKLEEYMLVNEEIVCSTYSVNTLVLRGIGSVCVDDSQNIYITYLYSDGSIKTAKIYMPSKSIFWNVPYKPNSASTYVPLDSVYYKGNLYLLVSESGDQAKFHIVKIPSDGQSVSNFASQIPSGNGTNEPYFNAIVALKDYIYIYGGRLRMANPMIVAYIVKYDLNGVNKGSRDHTFGTNNGGFVSIVRATSYNDEDVYALYNQSNSTRYKIIKMNDLDYFWYKDFNSLNFSSLYANQDGVYAGYSSENKSGYQRYDPSGNLKEDKFVIVSSTGTTQNDAVFVHSPSSAVFVLTSLSNKNAQFTSIPSGERTSYLYNPDGTDNAVSPAVTFNSSDTFTYRVKYVNYKNEAPASGYPKLSVYDNGIFISSGIMSIESSTNNYTDGRVYSFKKDLVMKPRYSYKIELSYGTDYFTSDEYFFPRFGDAPVIEYFEGSSYIFPDTDNKNINTVLTVKMKFSDPGGFAIHGDSPVFTLYSSTNGVIQNIKMIFSGNSSYYFDIGTLAVGSYSYKIEAKNTFGVEAQPATGSFEVKAFTADELPQILYFEGNTHILPKGKYADTSLIAKVRVKDPNNHALSDGYPILSLYSLSNGSLIYSGVWMSHVSEGVHQYNIGMLAVGEYKYKIEAKNIHNMEAVPAEGTFEVFDSANSISAGKVFNAPNPFNPARGQTTKIVFSAKGNENVKIKIYSLYGDKVFEDSFNAVAGTNEYEYRGRDNQGKMLYNGAYLCYVEKPSGNGKFKMLIIK